MIYGKGDLADRKKGLNQTSENGESVVEVELDRLHSFKDHPFRVCDDEDMYHLAESIRTNGVLSPAVVRPDSDGTYEILSGHRRKRACELCGLEKMPVVIKEMDDDAATIFMADSNIQRTSLLVSERAFAGKMRYEAMKRQGMRTDILDQGKGDSIDNLAREYNCSPASLRRLFRMTNLIPELLNMVDEKKFAFNSAVELSYLIAEEQEIVLSLMKCESVSPSLNQARKLRRLSKTGEITDEKVLEVLHDEELIPINVRLKTKLLRRYFPDGYTSSQIEEVILELLATWAEGRSALE